MILAAHVVFSAYGFWLPNTKNGSWSEFVRSWELLRFGAATKTDARRSVAKKPFDWEARDAARRALMYPPVMFNGMQALAIANGFLAAVRRMQCVLYACAIMPDHVHLVIGRHHYPIQQVANLLKGAATNSLRKNGLDPFSGVPKGRVLPSPWAHGLWKVWLDSHEDVRRTIEYVENNPVKEGLKRQRWELMVTEYPH